MTKIPTIKGGLKDQGSSWLKEALQTALTRDPLDAYYDAKLLAAILKDRLLDNLKGS